MRLARVLVGVDLTPASTRAAEWVARSFAPDAEITLLHCLDPLATGRRAHAARTRAGAALGALRDRIAAARCSVRIAVGDPPRLLAELAAEVGADLVAVGAHEEHADRLPTPGTTAQRLVRRSPVPVLLCSAAPAGVPRSLLLPVDSGEVAPRLAEATGALLGRFDARLAIVHVDHARGEQQLTGVAAGAPRAAGASWHQVAHGLPADRLFVDAVHADPGDAVLAGSRRFHSDLVLLRAPDAGSAGEHAGPVDRVMRRAGCPVLVVPSDDGAEANRGRHPVPRTLPRKETDHA